MDLQSLMGYASNSPYRNNPYLDINTPEGLITMENTPVDLVGIDNLGNIKKMKAGSKKQYKFPGNQVREIPVGNPYQEGGINKKQMFDFLFDGDDEEEAHDNEQLPTAPSSAEVDLQNAQEEMAIQQRVFQNDQNDALAMQVLNDVRRNPYKNKGQQPNTPYTGEILSSGQYGNQNVGEYGRQIYGELASDLGYTPTVNSIYRSPAQNNALIASGAPAVKNSYHLTGNAVDLKPEDWHRLSDEQQKHYRDNYDVVYHNNHYHIEPKN